ncbi:DUF7882 family protein [Rathayibacter sp. VKM Ac-2803]|uniref:DUF7882 family protein n=1 Tax=Rathayibacter sp. VKM Ac-2803 TaxID=2609256 RepID=UPI001F3E6763|nr:ATP-dependent DNA ligase [Rathayibacter sp. VKM Ac-2803]
MQASAGRPMGKLHYNSGTGAEFNDRLLAHLQLVIGTKLSKGESFYLSWKNGIEVGSGRCSIWLHPAIPLEFAFAGNRSPSINPAWIHQLVQDSYTVNGLRISPEPENRTAGLATAPAPTTPLR